ncbi:glycosyltransferase family 1 protein [Desulfuromonas carbonis]|uniref:glycosyltransferase family 4 protein n=1 Tax=Desulfuromonas sp. DDH964 TaxID=1823759 RepID=UPI00082C456D|nr:glycosyltransferase family 1 protein [Desulfuromonas sp. DDH964]
MRIAIVSETWLPQINGVSRTLNQLANYLVACGDQLLLLTPRYRQGLTLPVGSEAECFPALPLPFYSEVLLPVVTPLRLLHRLAAFVPDLVHIATEGPLGWAALRAARRLGLPVVSSYHTNFAQYLASYRLGALETVAWDYLRKFHNRTDLTLCPTPSIVGMLAERGFRNLIVWPRGVDAARFHPRHRDPELRRSLGIAGDEVVLLFVGRLAAEKNLALLFAACRRLSGRVRQLLVGDGPLRAELEHTALPGAIFSGYREGEELARYYASADIFAFPSLSETFGNVVLEALASGLPTVAFNVPGPRDILLSGESGILVEEQSATALAAALQSLVDDAQMRQRLGRAARLYAEDQNWEEINSAVRDQYLRLHAEHSGKRLCCTGTLPEPGKESLC